MIDDIKKTEFQLSLKEMSPEDIIYYSEYEELIKVPISFKDIIKPHRKSLWFRIKTWIKKIYNARRK